MALYTGQTSDYALRGLNSFSPLSMEPRAYRWRLRLSTFFLLFPENLNLPTTTGSVEAMNRRVRDLMRQTRSIKSPQALQLWATAMIRMRPAITCNGKHFQQKNLFEPRFCVLLTLSR